jgi:hypothetical protein
VTLDGEVRRSDQKRVTWGDYVLFGLHDKAIYLLRLSGCYQERQHRSPFDSIFDTRTGEANNMCHDWISLQDRFLGREIQVISLHTGERYAMPIVDRISDYLFQEMRFHLGINMYEL